MAFLRLLHFNDVYRVTKQKVEGGTIDVTQFAALIDEVRKPESLLLFSGDLFSPSVESSVTRGSHMVPIMNMIAPDVALTGNHDFDLNPSNPSSSAIPTYPWILSNIVDDNTGTIPKDLQAFRTFDRAGVRIGIIGLVEKNWIATVPSWPPQFQYRDMKDVAIELSKVLRDPNGPHRCDLIIALTHARLPNVCLRRVRISELSNIPSTLKDINFAKAVFAHSHVNGNQHGVDLVLGGHDHTYFVGRGAESWAGYDPIPDEPGTEQDDGVFLVKSGTDFRDLSEICLELHDPPEVTVRRKVIKSMTGRRHRVTPGMPSSEPLAKLLSTLLEDVSSSLSAPLCFALEEWDVGSEVVRTDESAIGNWIADVLRHAYDDAISSMGHRKGGADGVLICGGTLRGDSRYGPGAISIGDILEILPFEDPVIVIEIDGETLWNALESSLGMYPSQEGRFPIISGYQVEWDSSQPPGQRVKGIWLNANIEPDLDVTRDTGILVRGEEVKREGGSRRYKIVTREYMYQGHDGFEALMNKPCLVDEESGLIMSSIVRKFLLGSQYIHTMKQFSADKSPSKHHDAATDDAISYARSQRGLTHSPVTLSGMKWVQATAKVLLASQHSARHICDALRIGGREHMSAVDPFDGKGARAGERCKIPDNSGKQMEDPGDLVGVRAVVDGRMFDIARRK